MSTGLNCMSGLVYEDIIKPWIKKPLSPVVATRLIRLLAVIIGVICTGLVFLVEKLQSIFQVILKIKLFFNYSQGLLNFFISDYKKFDGDN